MSTAHRAKIKHKARETKKKRKKEAKKNPHLKKKKKKDPGIPNSFPFKEQILAEVAETRRLALEEKRRKENKVDVEGNDHVLEIQKEPVALQARPSKMEVDEEAPTLIDTSIPTTAAALDAASVIIYLLDARDPWSFRSIYVEEASTKPILFVLTKTDLSPRESVKDWMAQLRKHHPTFIFRATPSLCFKNTPQSGSNTKSKSNPEDAGCMGKEAILEALHTIAQSQKESNLSVAVVGVTNVGKSAFINSLLGTSTLAVYNPLGPKATAAPSTTPYPQSVSLQHKRRQLTFIDTPGLTFIPPPSAITTPEEAEERIARDVLLRNRGNISKIKDPLPLALYILSRASMEDLILLYNMPAVPLGDFDAFLASLARKEGALQKKGAIVDFVGAARALVRDWKTGRLAFYTFPSQSLEEPKPSSPSSAPDLSAVYTKWDEKYLARLSWRKDMRKEANISLVRLKDDELDRRKVDLEAVVLPSDDEMDSQDGGSLGEEEGDSDAESSQEDDEGGSEDEEESPQEAESDSDVEAMSDSDEEEEGSEEEPEPVLSGKQKRAAQKATKLETSRQTLKVQKPKKAVSFVPYTKAGAKAKPQPKSTSTTQPKQSAALSQEKKKKPIAHVATPARVANVSGKASKAAEAAGDDAYDFSKYF